MGEQIRSWHEHLIKGAIGADVSFTAVLTHRITGEMLITQYDRHAMVVRRYEWEGVGAGFRLTVVDWDDQVVLSRTCAVVPAPPRTRGALEVMLEELEQ